MVNSYKRKKYIFRIYGVSRLIVAKFQNFSFHCDYKIVDLSKVPIRKSPDKYTIIINLKKNKGYLLVARKINKFLKKYKISPNSYGIRVSLVTSNDTDEMDVPLHVLEFYKIVGGSFDCSFTSI